MTEGSSSQSEEPTVQTQVVNGGLTRAVPGNVACADGHIWTTADNMVATGSVWVSRAQALFALRYGWEPVPDKTQNGLIMVARRWSPEQALANRKPKED